MSKVILRGEEAIHYAEVHGMTLHEDVEGGGSARSGLTVTEARKRLVDGADGVWVEAHVGVNSAERVEHDPVPDGH